MPVEIRLPPRFQVQVNEQEYLELPDIQLAVAGNNVPHTYRINFSVRGTPSELALQIQKAYKPFDVVTPKISQIGQLEKYPCKLEKPLTEAINCTLQVIVEYFDSDASGEPLLSEPRQAKAACYLWSPAISQQPTIANDMLNSLEEQPNNQQQKQFPGWLALDFGTSNSTVTLFDPIEIPINEILPREQELRLRDRLAQWLNFPASEALPDISESEWQKFITDISKNLEIDPSQLTEIFKNGNQAKFLEAIRQIELCLGNSEKFRRAVSKKLHNIYHEVFRVPTLESQNLIPVILDIDRRDTEIPSELEIISLQPLKIRMGIKARDDRRSAIAQAKTDVIKRIASRFYHSPKRYFGQKDKDQDQDKYKDFVVTLDDSETTVNVNQLVQAAWSHLIELTEYYRQNARRRFSQGKFLTAVVTYPTVAPPVVRQAVKELVQQLGIPEVQTAYDEAVSVAIFFLWREFGGNLNIGIESFKTRCRREGNKWVQNVLVLDIGGGTTDLALIELTLEDQTPFFADQEDRGLGGRYYKLTPKLLGSSGHLQLGGELITLRVFRLLKVAIADSILTAITRANNDDSQTLEALDERFLEGGKFKTGSLLKCLDKEYPEGDAAAYKDALDAAEKVLPTRWEKAPQRLQTFYTLWDHAEEAKLTLGKKPPADNSLLTFTLSEPQISELLTQSNIKHQIRNLENISVTIDNQQFERVATSAIIEAIGIAKGLMASRLQSQKSHHKVDWLILSGKTCNLDLVQRHIYQEFSKSPYFVWNPERITFVLEFTKLATSAGACYAEKLRQLRFDPEQSKELLRKGANQLEIDVKNLFYYLPCNFLRKTQSNELLTIFTSGQELYQLALREEVAKARTNWLGIQLLTNISRQDYHDGTPRSWGNFKGEPLKIKLGMGENEFLQKIKIQFEIDQTLEFQVLLCQGNPHYLIDVPGIDVGSAISAASETALFADGKLKWNIAVEGSNKDLNDGDIAVNVIESATVDQPHAYHLVFEIDKEESQSLKEFHYLRDGSPEPGKGLISNPLPPFPQNNQHTFYVYQTDTETNRKTWIRIGALSKPSDSTGYPCKYRVTLDNKGILRMHLGEVPYWESTSDECLKQEGCVYRTKLEPQSNEVDKERDPFCGIH